MAEITRSSKLLEYKDKREAQEKWSSFILSEMSSFYTDEFIKSSNYMVIMRELSDLLATSELLFDQSSLDVYLETSRASRLFQNFGDLLSDRPVGFSDEEYRTFLKTVIKILFKGFTIVFSKEIPSELNSENIKIFYPDQIRNTSISSKGLNHRTSLMTQTKGLGFTFNSPSDANSTIDTSRENNRVIIEATVDSTGDFERPKLDLIVSVISEIIGSIVILEIRIKTDSGTFINRSFTKYLARLASANNFKNIIEKVLYFPSFSVEIEANDIELSDSYSISNVLDNGGNPIQATSDYFINVSDEYAVIDSVTEGFIQDNTPPEVLSTSPSDLQEFVPKSKISGIAVTFDSKMDMDSIVESDFEVVNTNDPGTPLAIQSIFKNDPLNKVTIFMVSDFSLSDPIQVTARKTVQDIFTNEMDSDYVFSFTVTDDETALAILSTSPDNGDTGVLVTDDVIITFDDDVDPASVTTSNINLKKLDAQENVTLEPITLSQPTSSTVKITPVKGYLDFGLVHKIFVDSDVKDTSGNEMSADWEQATGFTTEPPPPPVTLTGQGTSVITPLGEYSIIWTQQANVDHYNIYKNDVLLKTAPAGYSNIVIDLHELYFNDPSEFRVSPVRGGQEMETSGVLTLEKVLEAPVFEGPNLVIPGYTSGTLQAVDEDVTWTIPTLNGVIPSFFELEEYTNGVLSSSRTLGDNDTSEEFTRQNHTDYSYRIRTKVGPGSSYPDAYGPWSSINVFVRMQLSNVSGFSVNGSGNQIGQDSDGNWTLSWDAVPYAEYYHVNISKRTNFDEDGNSAIRLGTPTNSITFDGTGTWANKVHLVTVRAIDFDKPNGVDPRHEKGLWSDASRRDSAYPLLFLEYPYDQYPVLHPDLDSDWIAETSQYLVAVIETAKYYSPGLQTTNATLPFTKVAAEFKEVSYTHPVNTFNVTFEVINIPVGATLIEFRHRYYSSLTFTLSPWTYPLAQPFTQPGIGINVPIDDFYIQARVGDGTDWSAWSNSVKLKAL
jgi:hypothetical protein